MIIIDKNKKLPYFKWTPHPTIFKSTYEEQKYYAKEKQKWIEGDGELPGSLYFYLKEGWIKHRIVPKGHDSVEKPIPRAASLWMHQRFKKTHAKKEVQIVFKGRGIGLSSEGGALCNYYSKVFPGSNSIVTSKDQDGISVLFREKIYIPYQHLDARIRPDELAKNDTKQRCHLKLGVSHLGKGGDEQYSISTIELRETSEKPSSPTNFSGQGAAFGFWDEYALHPRKEELLNSAIECFRNPFTKELDGFLLAGGTLEDSMSNEDIEGFRQLVENKSLWNCDILFVPFWWGMFLDESGFPDEKRAMQWWEMEMEKLKNSPKKQKAFKKNNPRTMEDIFESASGGRWEEDVEEILKSQKTSILNADVSCPRYHIINLNNSVEPKKDNKGSTYILEPPKPNCIYMLGVDGVASDEETGGKEGSNMAGTIIKIFDPSGDPYCPVAIHSERPKTIESGYHKLVNLARYYDKYGLFEKIYAEANAATASHFGNFLMDNDLKKWVSMRKDFSGKGWVDTKKVFQYRTPELIEFQYRQANMFLRKYAHSIQMMPLIEDMLSPKNRNADILDSWLQFFSARPNFDAVAKLKPPPPKKEILTLVNRNGYMTYEKVTV